MSQGSTIMQAVREVPDFAARYANLANALAVGLYTALDRAGVPLPDNDGHYEPSDSGPLRPDAAARRTDPPSA